MERRGNTINTAFRDVLLSANLLISCLLILILPNINPPKPTEDEAAKTPGNMVITAVWADGPIDVDLWVAGPDGQAVGYSNRTGKLFNLLRDDLGTFADDTPMNYENAYSRGLPAGEYTVNLHCYSCSAPQEVTVEIRFGKTSPRIYKTIKVILDPRKEITVIDFKLDAEGNVVPGSENNVFRPLREGSK